MFETVVPEKFEKRNRKPLYEALPLSIAFHAVFAVAFVAAQVWEISFPNESPAQSIAFSIAESPPPPPPPPPPKLVQAQRVSVKPVEPEEIVAPTVIPDSIPEVLPVAVVTEVIEGAVPEGVEGGVPGGEVGGVIGGVMAGVIAPDPKVQETPGRVVVERDRPLGLHPLSQVYPIYPENARLRAWEDRLVVRYVIGKDGRVKDVSVISPPERTEFIQPTIRAIRSWRFRPLIKDGERQEVVHELTVFYKLEQAG